MIRANSRIPEVKGEPDRVRVGFRTHYGVAYQASIEKFLESKPARALVGKVQLIFTSPPYPLNRKKKYGNLTGQSYIDWLKNLAPKLSRLLKPDGSIVLELGNGWMNGEPTMTTLAIESFLAFLNAAELKLCQQFIYNNPARLPSPAQWVNVERIRVKDSFTYLWWMAKTPRPQADNRKVLTAYSPAMLRLLDTQKYNSGRRPSEHKIGMKSFLTNNNGAIPSNVLTFSNTVSSDDYLSYCKKCNVDPHPARMPSRLAEFFIRFLSKPRNLVFDPFGGSMVTGAVAEVQKRRWIGIEPQRDYLRGSRGRFQTIKKDYLK